MADPIHARVTINLAGARVGHIVLCDPDDPYTQMCLEKRYLVPTEPDDVGGAAEADPDEA